MCSIFFCLSVCLYRYFVITINRAGVGETLYIHASVLRFWYTFSVGRTEGYFRTHAPFIKYNFYMHRLTRARRHLQKATHRAIQGEGNRLLLRAGDV
jgi:hypothetical protein